VAIKQDVNVPLVVTIGIISGVFLLVLVIGTQAWYQSEEVDQAAIVADEFPHQQLIDLKATETGLINQYRWMDKAHDVVAIPIDKAIEIEIQNNGNPPATQPSGGSK
jgi:hypothetical protein